VACRRKIDNGHSPVYAAEKREDYRAIGAEGKQDANPQLSFNKQAPAGQNRKWQHSRGAKPLGSRRNFSLTGRSTHRRMTYTRCRRPVGRVSARRHYAARR